MTFATNMQTVANNLLSTYGQTVTFSRTTQGAFTPSTGAVAAGTSTTYTAKVQPSEYKTEEINNQEVLYGDVKLLTYSITAVLVGDTVSLDSVVYRVMSVVKTQAQGSTIVYKVQIRV